MHASLNQADSWELVADHYIWFGLVSNINPESKVTVKEGDSI